LADRAGFERRSPVLRHSARAGEQQHAAGGLVQAVQREQLLPELVLERAQGGAFLVGVQRARVHQQPGRLVDGDQVGVEVEDGQGVGHEHKRARPPQVRRAAAEEALSTPRTACP
jgi:hypothetical protein